MQTMRRYLVFLVVPCIFILDRWTKDLIVDHIRFMDGFSVAPFFNIVHARNLGGAFGLLSQHHLAKYVFTVFPLAVIAVIIYMVFAHRFMFAKQFSLLLILSGAIGNMYDRLMYGYVTDFLDFYFKGWHWPAFNVADISISVGIGLWIFAELFPGKKAEKKQPV